MVSGRFGDKLHVGCVKTAYNGTHSNLADSWTSISYVFESPEQNLGLALSSLVDVERSQHVVAVQLTAVQYLAR